MDRGVDPFFRDIYPFDSVPRIITSSREIAENLSSIYITDTTLRDGQQGWRNFTIDEAIKIYELLADIGDRGGIRATEVFLYTDKDREVAKILRGYGLRYPKVIAWIRATRNDLRLVIESGLDETIILTSISDYHIRYKFGLSREEVITKYLEVVEEAFRNGIKVKCSLEDITRADIYGTVIPFMKRVMELGEKYSVKPGFRLPDTLGLGLPFPEVPLPRGIPAIIKAIRSSIDISPEQLEFHAHNDLGLAIANQLSAWFYGVGSANCTLLGIGERAGNCPLEIMAIHYVGIKGSNDINLRALPRILDLFESMGYIVNDHYPIIGRNAFRTKAGIHADGLLKNPEVYLPFDPMKLLGKPYSIEITPYSGTAAIVLWIKNYLGHDNISKDDPRIRSIYNEVLDIYRKSDRKEPLTEQEMFQIVSKYFPLDNNKANKIVYPRVS